MLECDEGGTGEGRRGVREVGDQQEEGEDGGGGEGGRHRTGSVHHGTGEHRAGGPEPAVLFSSEQRGDYDYLQLTQTSARRRLRSSSQFSHLQYINDELVKTTVLYHSNSRERSPAGTFSVQLGDKFDQSFGAASIGRPAW